MATIDLSRHATDPRKHYTGVRMQQGRVLTDDDFNEHARLDAEDMRRTRIDTIGPVGSPDDGFMIAGPVIDSTTTRPTFTIKAGSFYLGGNRLTLEADELYHLQQDWLQQGASALDPILTTPTGPRYDFVWLETWQQPVSAVEDSELLEVALGGPDTSQRVRTLRRVRVRPGVANGDCNDAWATLLTDLAGQGTLNKEFELVPDARLQVIPDTTGGSSDLCSPPVDGGYLGAENQAIRVQIVGANEFTWGFDNGAPLYRVELKVDNTGARRRIKMLTLPKDQAHWPLMNQTVELLPWSAVLANGQKISELGGHLAKVTATYNPDTQTFDIDAAPANDASGRLFGETWKDRADAGTLDDEGEFFYLRVWNRGSDTASAARVGFTSGGTAVPLGQTGLRVRFTGTQLRVGDHWIIAARPEAPLTVVPWELLTNRRPHGVRRWIAPLAVIRWPGGNGPGAVINDCRETFLPLTRIRNCCTVTVGDGNESHGHFTSIQAAVNSLPEKGGRVCVLPGRYDEAIRIVNRHDIVISGCGPRTRIVGIAPTGGATTAQPVLEIVGGYNFGLEDFAVEAFDTGVGIDLLGLNPFSKNEQEADTELVNVSITGVSVSAGQRSALRARFVRELNVNGCEFSNFDRACLEPTVLLLGDDVCFERNVVQVGTEREETEIDPATGAEVEPSASGDEETTLTAPAAFVPGTNAHGGIQIEGTSERVLVRDNLIRGGSSHGITLGSVRTITDPNDIGPGDNDDTFEAIDLCDPKDDFDNTAEPDPENPDSRIVSTGPLEEIRIVGNRIHDHGGCGIGVALFWDLNGADEFIEVIDLQIEGNDIRRCLLRPILEATTAMDDMIGYGGIALASVEDLVIRDNVIAHNGAGPAEPVCGIFVLHGEGIDITRNRILENGSGPEASLDPGGAGGGTTSAAPTPKRGHRGGIVIGYALAPARVTEIDDLFNVLADRAPLQTGEPAAKIHDNIVTTPLGQALSLVALGPVSVQANQFTTRGLVRSGPARGFMASAVRIMNLGLSNEIMLQHFAFSFFGKNQTVDPLGSLNPANFDDLMFGRVMANGQVLFSDNQVNLDLLGVGNDFGLSSVMIVSLDDIGFHDNQCEANLYLLGDFILSQVLLFGFTVRADGNRIKEGILNAFFSALTLAFLGNTTTDNQGTHCIVALCFAPAKLIAEHNLAIIGPNPLLTMLADKLTCDQLQEMMQASIGNDEGEDQDTEVPTNPTVGGGLVLGDLT